MPTVMISVKCADCGRERKVAKSGHLPPERCRQCAMKAAMRQMIHKDKR